MFLFFCSVYFKGGRKRLRTYHDCGEDFKFTDARSLYLKIGYQSRGPIGDHQDDIHCWFELSHEVLTWWRHQKETFSTLLTLWAGNPSVTGEFPSQRPVTRSFDVLFDQRLNKQSSKQWWGWWFQTPSHPLWRHCNEYGFYSKVVLSAIRQPLLSHVNEIECLISSLWFALIKAIFQQRLEHIICHNKRLTPL